MLRRMRSEPVRGLTRTFLHPTTPMHLCAEALVHVAVHAVSAVCACTSAAMLRFVAKTRDA